MEVKEYLDRFSSLKNKRSKVEGLWEKILPYFTIGFRRNMINEGLPTRALEAFATGLFGSLVNPTQKWFFIETVDPKQYTDNPAIQSYCRIIQDKLYAIFASDGSNFNNKMYESFINLGVYGVAVIFIEETPTEEDSPIRLYSISPEECYLAENNKEKIDTVYRKFKMTNKSIVDKYGELTPEIAKNALEKPYEEVDILHIVQPIQSGQKVKNNEKTEKDTQQEPNKDENIDNKYISVFLLESDERILEEIELDYFPYLVPRWSKDPKDVWGFSPALNALKDIENYNKETNLFLRIMKKQSDSVFFINRSVVEDNEINLEPGAINYFKQSTDIVNAFKEITTGGDLTVLRQHIAEISQSILAYFFFEYFKMGKDRTIMTATESNYRINEQYRLITGLTSRVINELLSPLIDTVIIILLKFKLLEDPEFKSDINLKSKFKSAIEIAQKRDSIQNIFQAIQTALTIAQLDPLAAKRANLSTMFKEWLELNNINSKHVLTDEDMAKLEQTQNEAAQNQAMAEGEEKNMNNLDSGIAEAIKEEE